MKAAIFFLASLLGGPLLLGQDATFRLDVLSYQWTTSHQPLTFSWPGHANTSCNGSAFTNGYVSGGGNFYSNQTSYSTCSTTYTPPTNQTIDIQKPVVYILAESGSSRYVLTCTRNVRWSQCHALTPGIFLARYNNGHLEAQASTGNKEEWVKFDVVQQSAVQNPQGLQASTQPMTEDQRTRFSLESGDSTDLNNAAQSGILDAEMYLGYAYEIGKGVSRNPYTALVWYKKALAHPEIAVTDRNWIETQIEGIQAEIARNSKQ